MPLNVPLSVQLSILRGDVFVCAGVTSLHCLLLSAKDEDAPKLHVLLCEALMAVYVSLLVNGLAMFETQILYRLLANKLDQQTWGALFGGGCRTALKVEKSIPSKQEKPGGLALIKKCLAEELCYMFGSSSPLSLPMHLKCVFVMLPPPSTPIIAIQTDM